MLFLVNAVQSALVQTEIGFGIIHNIDTVQVASKTCSSVAQLQPLLFSG